MFARLTLTRVEPGQKEIAFKNADQIDALIRQAKGLVQLTWVYNEATGEYGAFSVWQTEADAETYRTGSAARVQEIVAQNGFVAQGDPIPPKTFTVYEAKR